MIKHKKLTHGFILLSATVVFSGSADAAILIENLPTDFVVAGSRNEPLAKVVVGGTNVPITGFGVYGQAQIDGYLKWIIFDSTQLTSPKYLSPAQAVSGNSGAFADKAQWYDITNINFTLLAGHTYAIGVIADQIGTNSFRWGASPDNLSGPYPTIAANGLNLPFKQSLDNSGVNGGAFTATPSILFIDSTDRRQMSLRIFGPGTDAAPEPASIILWSTLAALGIVASLRRRRLVDSQSRVKTR
jgi:hypothetical protein